MKGRTTKQINEALSMVSAPLRVIYVWPEGSPLNYPLRLMWKLLPLHCADFVANGRYSFHITYTDATVELVSSGKDPWTFLRGRDPRNAAVVIDHAVPAGPWDDAVEHLARCVAATMENRP